MNPQTRNTIFTVVITALVVGGAVFLYSSQLQRGLQEQINTVVKTQQTAPAATTPPTVPAVTPPTTPSSTPTHTVTTPTTSNLPYVTANGKTTITIMVPKDKAAYVKAATDSVNGGTQDPSKLPFVKKQITVTALTSLNAIMKAAVTAATNDVYTPGGGPDKVEVAYLKVVGGTVYVLLNMDVNAWAGVSYSIAQIHPVVEKTLALFPGITKIAFGVAPGDKIEDVQAGM